MILVYLDMIAMRVGAVLARVVYAFSCAADKARAPNLPDWR